MRRMRPRLAQSGRREAQRELRAHAAPLQAEVQFLAGACTGATAVVFASLFLLADVVLFFGI